MKKAIVVGSGAGGAASAKALQGKFDVTVLEAGGAFRPFPLRLSLMEKMKKTGLFLDEREIQFLFPNMKVRKTPDKMVLVNGIGLGGTTVLSAGNALRMDGDLKKLGINLDAEFEEVYREIPVTAAHEKNWREMTNRLFAICKEMELNPMPTPKMGDYRRCTNCGQCVLGCKYGVKWDSRNYLDRAVENGAQAVTNCKVDRVVIENGRAAGVLARSGLTKRFFPADLVILAAGGMGTPVILQNSGIQCQNSLFVDPVLCVAAHCHNSLQNREISMPFVVQREHYILSPYFDHLSFYFNRNWKFLACDTQSLMIKLKDSNAGSLDGKNMNKVLLPQDKEWLKEGVEVCTEIHRRLGTRKEDLFLGTINAGHPGGMLPLTADEADTFHNSRLPENLYVADATLFPASLGNPPILTIIAMAKKVCKLCLQKA